MTSCPTDDDLVRFIDGALSLEDTERASAHLTECARCRRETAALRALAGDIAAQVPAQIDARAHAHAVMARLDRPVTPPARPVRTWWFAGATAALACSVVLVAFVGLRGTPAPATGPWAARGGGGSATIARDVGVQPYAVQDQLRPLASGMTIDRATPLTAGFRNLGGAPVYLLLFAVDARRVVHWISPAYARPEDDPVATPLPITAEERALETTAVLDDVTVGPLRIIAVITPVPAHVSDVEALEGTELSASSLVRRLPGAEVRETVVEVRGAGGAP